MTTYVWILAASFLTISEGCENQTNPCKTSYNETCDIGLCMCGTFGNALYIMNMHCTELTEIPVIQFPTYLTVV